MIPLSKLERKHNQNHITKVVDKNDESKSAIVTSVTFVKAPRKILTNNCLILLRIF